MARKTELTREIIKKIADNIYPNGNYFEIACELSGVARSTGYAWLAMARGEKRRRPGVPEDLLLELLDAVNKANAEIENATVVYWRSQTQSDWRAAAEYLARRFPDRWKPVQRNEHTGAQGAPIQTEDVTLTDAERINRIAAILDAARARQVGQAPGESAGEV